MEEREFTVEEANALIPAISDSLRLVRQARQVVLDGAKPFRRAAAGNGGGEQSPEYWAAMATLSEQVTGLIEQGIILRDAESGLVDFPTRRDGRLVFLCWRLGEERVAFWHGPESGFAGRQPI